MSEAEATWPHIMPPFEEVVVDHPIEEAQAVEEKRKPKAGARKNCDICGKNYSIKHLYAHKRKVHGIFGGRTGVTRAPYNRKKQALEIAAPTNGHKADKLPALTAEQITRAAAEALWPDGIPHDRLSSLLRWNIQTHYFLAEVQSEQHSN